MGDPTGFDSDAVDVTSAETREAWEDAGPQNDFNEWVAQIEDRARDVADLITVQMQEHPVRTLAIAGALGFVLASSMKARIIPALVRSGAGLAAAMVFRQIAAKGWSGIDVGQLGG